MTVQKITMWLAACFLIAAPASPATAQFGDLGPGHDLQFFSPIDFDFDNQPVRKSSGLYFRYEKLSWAITGERVVIGDQTVNVQSEVFLPATPVSLGTAPPTYQVINSIQDAPHQSDFAWGERYEFGLQSKGTSWDIGILDGPEVNTSAKYGFNEISIPGTLPFNTRTGNDNNGLTLFDVDNIEPGLSVSLFPSGPNDVSTSINGFGSVAVNFRTPPGFLSGLRDYWVNGITNGPVVNGPGRQLLVEGAAATFVNGVLTENQITAGTFATGAELLGIEDDLNGNGMTFFFVDLNENGTRDANEPAGIDYGDLHNFNVFFDTLIVRNTTDTDGIELMHTIDLPHRHQMKKNQNSRIKIGTGVRYFRLRDQFSFEGRGSILGLTLASTDVQNSIVGPQLRAQWHRQQGRWGLDVDGRFMWGYNVQDLDLDASIGQDLIGGGINRSATGRPTTTRSGRHDETFSPFVEFRADASYSITSSISARLGYTALFIDNITRGSQVVDYVLPNPGLLKGGQQDIFINGVNFGFDVVY